MSTNGKAEKASIRRANPEAAVIALQSLLLGYLLPSVE